MNKDAFAQGFSTVVLSTPNREQFDAYFEKCGFDKYADEWYERLWTMLKQFWAYLKGEGPSPFAGHPNQAALEEQAKGAIQHIQGQTTQGDSDPNGNGNIGNELKQEVANQVSASQGSHGGAAGAMGAGAAGVQQGAANAGFKFQNPINTGPTGIKGLQSPTAMTPAGTAHYSQPSLASLTQGAQSFGPKPSPINAAPTPAPIAAPTTPTGPIGPANPNYSAPKAGLGRFDINLGNLARDAKNKAGQGIQAVRNMIANPSAGAQAAGNFFNPKNLAMMGGAALKGGIIGGATDYATQGVNKLLGHGTGEGGAVDSAAARAGQSGSYLQDVRQNLVDSAGSIGGGLAGGGAAGGVAGGAMDLIGKGYRGLKDIGSTASNLYHSTQQVKPIRPGDPKFQPTVASQNRMQANQPAPGQVAKPNNVASTSSATAMPNVSATKPQPQFSSTGGLPPSNGTSGAGIPPIGAKNVPGSNLASLGKMNMGKPMGTMPVAKPQFTA